MKLKSLYIRRTYQDVLGGEIEFSSDDKHELKIVLTEDLSKAIVRLCADAIVEAGKGTAQALVAETLVQNTIEHQP